MRPSPLHRWFSARTVLAGLVAIGWLLLRSGARPSRLAYPCQQAAVSTATLAFGYPIVAAVLTLRRLLTRGRASLICRVAMVVALIAGVGALGYLFRLEATSEQRILSAQPAGDYRADVFHLDGCPRDPEGDRFPCLTSMIELMGEYGLKFYRSPTESLTAGPSGIIAADDTIIIKINYQWAERGGSNIDVLRGLIFEIIEHVDGFSGEIVVCENAQSSSVHGFDRSANNAQDTTISPFDVVTHSQQLGYNVSLYDWGSIRLTPVGEYSQGDPEDGYVVSSFDPRLHGAVSYPKFRTIYGTRISLRDGIWNPGSSTYDRQHLKFINLPVLKSHSIYGVTANVKDYMGVVTRELDTNSHSAVKYGLLGAHLGVIGLADLNILDAIWVNAHPDGGPSTDYGEATRRDELVVSTDPVAADLWSARHILIPSFQDNGYSEWPKADPDDPESKFREYLDNSAYYLLEAGLDVTTDADRIDLYSASAPLLADGFESGSTSAWSSD